jgi:hypothetical protein
MISATTNVSCSVEDHRRNLVYWRPGLETTRTPVEILWGPGSWEDLRSAVTRADTSWQPDSVRLLDRIFFVRIINRQTDVIAGGQQSRLSFSSERSHAGPRSADIEEPSR